MERREPNSLREERLAAVSVEAKYLHFLVHEVVAFAHRDPQHSEDLGKAEAFQAQDGSEHPVLGVIKTGKPVLVLEWERDYLRGERSLAEALARSDIREAPNPAVAIRDDVVRGMHQDDIAVLTLRVDGRVKQNS